MYNLKITFIKLDEIILEEYCEGTVNYRFLTIQRVSDFIHYYVNNPRYDVKDISIVEVQK